MSEMHAVLGFDMETDCGSWSPFYRGLENGTPKLLELLERREIEATFFFTGHAAQEYPEVVKSVVGKGHEVGCHSLYHETLGDPLFEIPGVEPLLPEEVPLRVRRATEWVADALGEQPVSFRSPRLWGSTAVVNALEDLGYAADASYPLYFYEDRMTPYYPSRQDWTEPGCSKVLEIPNFADMTIESEDPYGRDRDQWPLFRTASANKLMDHIDNFAGYARDRGFPVVLCFYFHPWEFVEMPKSFHYGEGTVVPDPFLVENCGEYALEQLEALINALAERSTDFCMARALAADWSHISDDD
jgi:peptidoglycan/xylan/chitin deacetylase (PgdA/CDA1 family)